VVLSAESLSEYLAVDIPVYFYVDVPEHETMHSALFVNGWVPQKSYPSCVKETSVRPADLPWSGVLNHCVTLEYEVLSFSRSDSHMLSHDVSIPWVISSYASISCSPPCSPEDVGAASFCVCVLSLCPLLLADIFSSRFFSSAIST
jgi:hypothetical protein